TVSALQNVMIADWVHAALPKARVEQFQSSDAALQALEAKRADAFIAESTYSMWTVKNFPDRYIDSGYAYYPNSIGIAVKPGDQIWLNWLNIALHEAKYGIDFDAFAEIYKKWSGIELPKLPVGFPSGGA